MSNKTAALWIAGLLGAGALLIGSQDKPPAAPAPPGTPGGTATIGGGGSSLQTRPIPAWSTLSAAGQQAYVTIMQQELAGPLGYVHVVANGDWNDANTAAAITQFLVGNRQAATAYGYTGGANEYADVVAIMKAVDDIARTNLGGDPSTLSDYVAPSSGLASGRVAARPPMLRGPTRR